MKARIIGIDVARAFAVIGMIIVNFKTVFGQEGNEWLQSISYVFDGKAAATFVVLAGIGLAMMTKSAIKNQDKEKLAKVRMRIIKRALFLFIVGLSYIVIWPADILHFYGIYMLITLLVLTSNKKLILVLGIAIIFLFPLLLTLFNYELGWNFDSLNYEEFWTPIGFIRNLFFNGFHPVLPWSAFMLFGFWFGSQDLHNTPFLKKAFWISLVTFILIQIISKVLITVLSFDDPESIGTLTELFGTNPMPPLPLYMFNGISMSLIVITGCILVSKKFEHNKIIKALYNTGQLALTFYVAHVVIGIGIIELFKPIESAQYSIEFSLVYALIFSLLCIVFAIFWRKYKSTGPLEWIMRKLTD